MIADRVHRASCGARMQPAAGAELDAWHVVTCQVNGVGAGTAKEGRRRLLHDRALRVADRGNDRKVLVEEQGRIGHREFKRRLVRSMPFGKLLQHRPQSALHPIRLLSGHGADIQIDIAFVGIARQPPGRTAANAGDRDIGVLVQKDILILERLRPNIQIVTELSCDIDSVDGARFIRQRRMRNRSSDRNLSP